MLHNLLSACAMPFVWVWRLLATILLIILLVPILTILLVVALFGLLGWEAPLYLSGGLAEELRVDVLLCILEDYSLLGQDTTLFFGVLSTLLTWVWVLAWVLT